MIHLKLAGGDTQLLSSLCASCPQGPTGCCMSPPEYDWSDIGRVVALGGRDWVLEQIALKNLIPSARGLEIRRARRRESNTEPRRNKCVHHGPTGCTIDPSRRPATCNYFLCEDVYVEGGEKRGDSDAMAARRAHAALIDRYTAYDRQITEEIAVAFPEGVRWDAAFLDWLGAEVTRLAAASPRSTSLGEPASA